MNTQETTIEVLQNRIKYLEAHLHLALQVLDGFEEDSQASIECLEWQRQSHPIDIVPISKIELPKFLNARTWKQEQPKAINLYESRDRLVANAS